MGRIVALLLLMLAGPAAAERWALVVGNDAYESLPGLQKARNDAQAVSAALTAQGFQVTLLTDAGRRDMTR
ncbi:MAG: caspase family protein, partial [Rhodobacteraceae bacterium]|nr:caspase family protein [Paracoccaceae bacterium]